MVLVMCAHLLQPEWLQIDGQQHTVCNLPSVRLLGLHLPVKKRECFGGDKFVFSFDFCIHMIDIN